MKVIYHEEKVSKEPVELRHAPAIQKLASDPAVSEMTRVPYPYPEGGAEVFIRESILKRSKEMAYVFCIKTGPEIVGVVGLQGVSSTTGINLFFKKLSLNLLF